MKKPIATFPDVPAGFDLADATAIQALTSGTADPDQQVRALKWIVDRAAGTYYLHYYKTERDTAFALGMAFVGQQIVKLSKMDLSALRRAEHV